MRYDPILCHRLLFGIRPPAPVIRRIGDMFALPGMDGRRVRAANLHVAVDVFEDSQFYPARLVQGAIVAAATIDVAPFEIALDRLAGSPNAVTLRPSRRVAGLQLLHEAVRAACAEAGLPLRAHDHFNPQMTILLRRDGAPFAHTIEPIAWRVDELVLIDSLVGSARQDDVGHFPLTGAPDASQADAPRQYALL